MISPQYGYYPGINRTADLRNPACAVELKGHGAQSHDFGAELMQNTPDETGHVFIVKCQVDYLYFTSIQVACYGAQPKIGHMHNGIQRAYGVGHGYKQYPHDAPTLVLRILTNPKYT
jgi:hypothetical protein